MQKLKSVQNPSHANHVPCVKFLVCVVVLSTLARGATAAPPVKSHSSKRSVQNPATFNQNEMNRKAEEEFTREDARLNIVYKKVLGELDAVGRQRLVRAQRAWLAYRDAQARLDADEMRGGSAEPMLYSGAQAAMTRERVKALQSLLRSR